MKSLELGMVPPRNMEAETLLLKGLIEIPAIREIVIPHILEKIFYDPLNQAIFDSINNLYLNESGIDTVTLKEQFKKQNNPEELFIRLVNILTQETPTFYANTYIEYLNIIHEKFFRRRLVDIFSQAVSLAFDESKEIQDIVQYINVNVDKYIFGLLSENNIDANKSIENTIGLIEREQSGESKTYYKTGNPLLDEKLYFSPNNITLIGGPGGHGKTRWLIHLMIGLLQNNEDIAILWYNMEDSHEKIMRCFIGYYLKLNEESLRSRKTPLSASLIDEIRDVGNEMKKYDIVFMDKSDTIENIYNEFVRFVAMRRNKFCLLILDNIMLLDNHEYGKNQTSIDDHISKMIARIKQVTNKLSKKGTTIIPVHHLVKDVSDKLNLKDAYRPTLDHLKGSSRYENISTQVILVNNPSSYKDLIVEFKHIHNIIANLFITEIAKNRDGQKAIIRWFANIETVTFKEINSTNSENII